jgi:hypothetical protein
LRVHGWGSRGYIPAVVNVGAAAEKEVLHGLEILRSLIARLENEELRSTVVHSLLSLALGAGEDHDVGSHSSTELDSQVAETANSHNSNSLLRSHIVLGQDCEDGGSGAEQRRGVCGLVALGDVDNGLGIPHGAVGEGAVVVVGEAIDLALSAVLVAVGAAVVAGAADLVGVSESNSVTDLYVCDSRAGLAHDTNALVAQDDAAGLVELVCSADARVCCLDEDLVVLELTLDVVGDDLALWCSAEDLVRDLVAGRCEDHCCGL